MPMLLSLTISLNRCTVSLALYRRIMFNELFLSFRDEAVIIYRQTKRKGSNKIEMFEYISYIDQLQTKNKIESKRAKNVIGFSLGNS